MYHFIKHAIQSIGASHARWTKQCSCFKITLRIYIQHTRNTLVTRTLTRFSMRSLHIHECKAMAMKISMNYNPNQWFITSPWFEKYWILPRMVICWSFPSPLPPPLATLRQNKYERKIYSNCIHDFSNRNYVRQWRVILNLLKYSTDAVSLASSTAVSRAVFFIFALKKKKKKYRTKRDSKSSMYK